MATYSTLAYAGNEMTFAAWGFGWESVFGVRNTGLKPDTFEAEDVTAKVTDDPAFAFEGAVVVRINRVSAAGSANSFSGGSIKFQGKRVLQPAAGNAAREGIAYKFEGPTYDLSHTQFLQPYKGVSGNFNPGKLVLFASTQNAAGNLYIPISVGDQIQAILQFLLDRYTAQGFAAPLQYKGRALHTGAIDLTRTGTITGFSYTYAVPTDGSATIDPALFNLYLPTYEVKSLMCSDALNKCLELSPRTNIAFDYSTTPPTIHVKSVDNFPSVTLPIADGVSHKAIQISPRPDLVARAVVIPYEIQNTVSGAVVTDYAVDKWGPNGANSSLDPSDGLRVLVESIALRGFNEAYVTGHLDCQPLAATSAQAGTTGGTSADTAAKRAWWSGPRGGEQGKLTDSRVRFQSLVYLDTDTDDEDEGDVDSSHITVAAAPIPDATLTYATDGTDTTGATVTAGQALTAADLAFYPNRLVRGTHHLWMQTSGGTPIKTLKVRCLVKVQYVTYDAVADGDTLNKLPASESASDVSLKGNVLENFQGGHDIHANLEITNGTTGDYSTISTFTPGEAYIIGAGGIAEYLYTALSVLQYEGSYVKVAVGLDTGISVVNCLNLSGGRTEWATMNAQIQSVRENYARGETEVQIGIARHLSAGQLKDMLNGLRFRYPWYNPIVQVDNAASSDGPDVDMAKTAGSANSTGGIENIAEKTVVDYTSPTSTPTGMIRLSAPIVTQLLAAASGTAASMDAGKEPWRLQPREVAICVNGATYFAVVLMGGLYTKA